MQVFRAPRDQHVLAASGDPLRSPPVSYINPQKFLGSKITADGDCSHEIKRRLILGRKVMTNLDSTLKSRDIALPTKFCLVKAMFFSVVMYGCECGLQSKLSTKILMLLNCCVGEDS